MATAPKSALWHRFLACVGLACLALSPLYVARVLASVMAARPLDVLDAAGQGVVAAAVWGFAWRMAVDVPMAHAWFLDRSLRCVLVATYGTLWVVALLRLDVTALLVDAVAVCLFWPRGDGGWGWDDDPVPAPEPDPAAEA